MAHELVLVVDDDPDLRDLVSTVLADEGFRVASAANGREALEAVAREVPALILLDLRMPVMDGWTFATLLRQRYGRRIPVVILTAAEDVRARAEEIGAENHLGKPFDLDDLVDRVRRHLRPSDENR